MNNDEVIKHLHRLLKAVQKKMFKSFYASKGRKYVIHSSRRLGKTFLLVVLACITAFSKPNAQIRYASVTQKAVKKMVHPIFKDIFKNVPASKRPKLNTLDGVYRFSNGSEIHIAGVNAGHSDDLRGTAADLCLVDEASFIDELSYLIDSVLIPQLLTTNGKLVMASSSPLSPAHEFTGYIQAAQAEGQYSSYTIYDGGYEPELITEFMKEAGGATSTTWRREYLNELIVDDEMSIVPEFSHDLVVDRKPDEFRRYYHNYSSADWGVRDKTAILWGYYDFKRAKLVIESEFTVSGPETTTKLIADQVRAIDIQLGYESLYKRVADNNNLLILNDLSADYNLHFAPTTKEAKAAMVNELRLWVADKRVEINPRCTELIGCLEYGVYADSKRNDFGRSKVYGHFDLLDSLIYLVRNLDTHTNPVPATFGIKKQDLWVPIQEESNAHREIRKIFNI